MRTTQGDVYRKNSEGWGKECGRNSFPSLPLSPYFFFPFSNFAPHSTISKPGKGYIKGDHDFRDVVIESPWRITVLATCLASRLSTVIVQVVYPYFRLRFRVICQSRYKEALHFEIFNALITAKHRTAGRSSSKKDQKRTCITSPWLRSNHLIAFFLEFQVWKKVTENT